MTPAVNNPLTPAMANNIAKQAIRTNAIKKRIQLNAFTVVPANAPTVNIQLQNVGILRGVLIKTAFSILNSSAGVINLSDFGPANVFSQIVYNDLSNVTRIQTTGAHLFMIDSLRRQGIMGAAYTNDNPGKFGAVQSPIVAPATIAAGATANLVMYHYLPVAYSDSDFRGAVFSNITNASQSIQLTFGTPSTAAGVDSVNAVYGGSALATITTATITAYQDVWDQIPDLRTLAAYGPYTPAMWRAATGDVTGLMLPNWDMRFMYELKNSPFGNIAATVENTFPYTNQRQFLSTILQYNNGSGTPRAVGGTDLNYIRLVAANSYEWWKMDPLTVLFEVRRILSDDVPAGFYIFDTREKPINTVVSGNIQLAINPVTASAGANANLFYEDFALTSSVTAGSSLLGGN